MTDWFYKKPIHQLTNIFVHDDRAFQTLSNDISSMSIRLHLAAHEAYFPKSKSQFRRISNQVVHAFFENPYRAFSDILDLYDRPC